MSKYNIDQRKRKEEYFFQKGKKPHNFKWTDNLILSEVNNLASKLGRFPTFNELELIKGLEKAVTNYGGIKKIRNELNIPQLHETWDHEKIKHDLRIIIDQLGSFPNQSYLNSINKSNLYYAMYNNGGVPFWKQLFNFKIIKPQGYWKILDNLKQEIESSFKEMLNQNQFPTADMIRSNIGCSAIDSIRYFGGIQNVANKMGYNTKSLIQAPDGHYVRSGYEYIVDYYLWTRNIPHQVDGFIENSKYRYDFKIGEYYVEVWGFNDKHTSTRAKYYINTKQKKLQIYSNLKLIEVEGDKLNKSHEEVMLYLDTVFGNKGFNTLPPVNIENYRKHFKYWNITNIIEEINIIKQTYHQFSFTLLREIKRYDLIHAIQREGGIRYIRKQSGVDI